MIELTRDQRRTLRRAGWVTVYEVIDFAEGTLLTDNPQPLPWRDGNVPKEFPVYPDDPDRARARVFAVTRDGLQWAITLSISRYCEEPRFLRRGRGTTNVPDLALADPDYEHEPQMVPAEYEDELAERAEARNNKIKSERLAELRRGIDSASAGLADASLTRMDRKDLERIDFYVRRMAERAEKKAA